MEDILHNLLYIYTIPSWEHIHIHIFQCTFESMIFLPISTGAFRRGPKYIPLIPRCTEPFLFGGKDPGECNSVGMMEVCIRIAKSSNMLRLILKIVTDCHSSKVFHGFSICSYGSLSLGNPHFKSLKRQTAVHSPKQAVFFGSPIMSRFQKYPWHPWFAEHVLLLSSTTCHATSKRLTMTYQNCGRYCWWKEEILHHLGCIKPCKIWDKLPINWCRISSINSSIAIDNW